MALSDDLAQVKLQYEKLVAKLRAIVDTGGSIFDLKAVVEEFSALPSDAEPVFNAAIAACQHEASPEKKEAKKKD